jgi:sugar phosphate isomerase/epimerase
MNRRTFIENASALGLLGLSGTDLLALPKKEWFRISLAEWSVHKAIFGGTLDNLDFPAKAKNDFGIEIVEYVNTCFKSKTKDFKANGSDAKYLKELMKRCLDNGVENHLIMCDAEGDLGDADSTKRKQTVENHHKWVNAAVALECKTIRVNAGGKGTAEEIAKTAADGLFMLGEYAEKFNINVIVENHGSYSSNGKWLSSVLKTVGLKNVGALPDFGNFCITRNKANWRICEEDYDRYLGTSELMPYAKGVSAKTNEFNEKGDEANMDYKRLLKIVKKSGFRGIVGIEYEGEKLSEDEGIKATLALLKKLRSEV